MADNITLNSGSGGSDIATDDDGTAHHQYVKVEYGADNTQTKVTAANGLPVQNDSSNTFTVTVGAALPAGTNAIGKLAANSGVTIGAIEIASSQTIAATNAGTFAVQESGSALTALQVIDDPVLVDDAAFTPASSSVMMAGFEYNDTTPDSVDEGDAGAARMSARRELYVQVRDAAGNERGLNVDSNGYITANINGTVTVGSHAVTNAGTFAVQAAQSGTWNITNVSGTVSLPTGAATAAKQPALGTAGSASSDVISVQGVASMTALVVDATGQGDVPVTLAGETVVLGAGTAAFGKLAANSGVTIGAVEIASSQTIAVTNAGTFAVQVSSALPAGTNAIGKLAANSGVDIGDVDVTSISAGTNLIGDVGISGARTSGGTTFYSSQAAGAKAQIKGSAGQLYWISAINIGTSLLYLQVFNAASASVTLGSTTPDLVFPIPTQNATAYGAGFVLSVPNGIAFGTGITIAITTTATGATTSDSVYLNAGYA